MIITKNKVVLISILLSSIAFLISCSSPEVKDQFLYLSGDIKNSTSPTLSLVSPGVQLETSIIDGHFEFKIPDSIPPNLFQIQMEGGDIPVFLIPNKTLEVNFDEQNIEETLEYIGKTEVASSYFWDELHKDYYAGMKIRFELSDERLFVESCDNFFKLKQESLDLLKSKKNKYFYALARANLSFMKAEEKLYYGLYHSPPETDTVELSDGYFSFLDDLSYDQEEFIQLPNYESFLTALVYHKSPDSYYSSVKEKFQVIKDEIKNPSVLEFMYYHQLDFEMSYIGVDNIKDEYEWFKSSYDNEIYLSHLDKMHQEWLPISKGKHAPEISGYNTDNKRVSIQDYRGKIVYIDVWATWCGPCVAEIPFLDELREIYKDENLFQIVSISIDRDKSMWKNFLIDRHSTGIQWWVENDFESQLCTDYLIKGIPRFILIDDQGKIITAGAPRPSEKEKLITLIDLGLTQIKN